MNIFYLLFVINKIKTDDCIISNKTKITEKISNLEMKDKTAKKETGFLDLDDFDDAPVLPTQEDDDIFDLQKELENKFDELFGPLDDEDN